MSKLFLLLIVFAFAACAKKAQPEPCFKVKFIEGICATQVYQIIDNAFQLYGQDGWRASNGQLYDNVIQLGNPCITLNRTADSTAMVQIEYNIGEVCVTCAATIAVPPPNKVLSLKPCK